MKKTLAVLFTTVLLTAGVIRLQAQQTLQLGIVSDFFTAATLTVSNGTAYALPAQSTQCTWVTSFGSAPMSVTVLLQTSLDNTTYNTLDTSTSTAGETRNINTSAVFIRARVSAASGGTTVTVNIICKSLNATSLLSSNNTWTGNQTFAGDITITGTCTGCGGTAADPDTSVQFNDGGAFGGDSGLTWDNTAKALAFGGNLPMGTSAVTIAGGDDTFGDAALILDNVNDGYVVIRAAETMDIACDSGCSFYETTGTAQVGITANSTLVLQGTQVSITAVVGMATTGNITLTAASADSMSADAGSHITLAAGDGDGMGAGGNVYLNAGGSGTGTPGDVLITSSDFIQLLGPVKFGTNGSIATGVTAANNLILRAYDVNAASYVTLLTLTSNNAPDLTIAPSGDGTVTLQATTFKSSDGSTGATGAVCTSFKNGLCVAVM